jgi:dCTP diphosphatase
VARRSGSGSSGELSELQRRLEAFRDERDWSQFHTLKDLASAISIEASELAEHFLWVRPDEERRRLAETKGDIEAELADVFIQALNFASAAEIDVIAAITAKISANEARYPVSRSRGSAAKHSTTAPSPTRHPTES